MVRSPRTLDRLVAHALDIEAISAKDAGMLGYMPSTFVMVTLPHSKPDTFFYHRKNCNYSLTMTANPEFGLPYGGLARLLLAWLVRKAKITRSPVIHLGKTISSLLKELKLSRSGGKRGDITYLREQMIRLCTTSISWVYYDKKIGVCKGEQFTVAKSFNLWWNPAKGSDGNIFLDSTITLSDEFFKEIMGKPFPIDLRVLVALKHSPMKIDLYEWLAYRLPNIKKETFIPWVALKNQFGSDYANNKQGLRDFKKRLLLALKDVQAFYVKAQVEAQDDGLMLYKSPPHVMMKGDVRGDQYVH